MKKFAKHFLKVLLAAMVASMTVTGVFALETEQVETAQEISITAALAAYYAKDETVVLGTSESTTLTFENDVTEVNVGTTEATYAIDGKSVTVTGVGYAGVVTATDGTEEKTVKISQSQFKCIGKYCLYIHSLLFGACRCKDRQALFNVLVDKTKTGKQIINLPANRCKRKYWYEKYRKCCTFDR